MTHVYFTKNTEYHVAEGICVRVIRRDDGRRLSDHVAVGARLLGGVRFPTSRSLLSCIERFPRRGECLAFTGDEGIILSTTIEKTQARDASGMLVEEDGEEVATWRRQLA